jgi:hypothetical protein
MRPVNRVPPPKSAPKDKDSQMSKDDHKNDRAPRPGNARLWRAAAVAATLAVAAVMAAACGGGGPQAPGSGPSSDQNLATELDSFASCVRSHGVPGFHFTTTIPPSDVASLGIGGYYAEYDSTPAFEAAQKACQHLYPGGMTPPSGTHQEFLRALRSAECMRSHGYPDWPDPDPTRLGFRVPVSIDTNSPQFQAAAKTCGLPPGV